MCKLRPDMLTAIRSPLWRIRYLLRGRSVYFSTITCPSCGRSSHDQMPGNASVHFYRCLKCQAVFRPKPWHCCVYCSYGDVPCPWAQREKMTKLFLFGAGHHNKRRGSGTEHGVAPGAHCPTKHGL